MKSSGGCVSKYRTKSGERLWRYRLDGNPIDGKRQQFGKAGFATRGEALTAMQEAIAGRETEPQQARTAISQSQAPVETLASWMQTWLRDYAPEHCSPKTLERYRELAAYVTQSTDPAPTTLATTPLKDINHVAVEKAIYAILRAPAKRREHLSPKTVREIASVLRVALNEAFRLDMITVNPLLKVRLPKVPKKTNDEEARALTPDEIQRLRDACRGDWTFPLVQVGLATGCRRGELLALEWSDIDWINSRITISRSLEETAAGLRIKPTKNEKPRRFRIGPSAISVLRFQQEQQQEHRRLCGPDYRDAGLVFCNPDGSQMRPALVSQTIVRRLQKAGIKGASLHSLRHTHASILLSRGVPLPAVSARLGHADVNITARIYSHMIPDDDARAAEAWETVSPNAAEALDTPSAKDAQNAKLQ